MTAKNRGYMMGWKFGYYWADEMRSAYPGKGGWLPLMLSLSSVTKIARKCKWRGDADILLAALERGAQDGATELMAQIAEE